MEITFERPLLSFSTIAQVGRRTAHQLAGFVGGVDKNQRTKATTDLSSHLLCDIGLNPIFALHGTSQPHLWRI